MKTLSKEDELRIWREVEEEFPNDPMMRELHFVRLRRYYELADLPLEERIRRFVRVADPVGA